MFMLFLRRMRACFFLSLFSGAALAVPATAQTGPNEVSNELLKDDASLIIESKGAFLSGENFMIHYAKAIEYVNNMKNITYDSGETAAVIANKGVLNEGREEWHLLVHGQRQAKGQVHIQPARAVFVNYGRFFHYLFTSHDISPIVYDRVDEKLAKRRKDIIEKFDDVKVSFSRYGNQLVLNATYDFKEGEQDIASQSAYRAALNWESTLSRRMRFAMEESVKLMSAILVETEKAEKDARKELEEQTLTYLNGDIFEFLVEEDFEGYEVEDSAKEGRWDFSLNSTEAIYEIYNYGDRLVFSMVEEMPTTSEEQKEDIVKQVNSLAAKKPAKGAHSMEVLRHPENTDYVWVKAGYELNGEIRGKDVAKSYSDFRDDYAKDFHKKIMDVFKDYEKAAEQIVKEAQNKTYSSLTQDEFMLLADDDLEENLEPNEEVQNGHWSFYVGEEERSCEIFNYGDRIVYTLAVEMPTDSEKTWDEIVEKVGALVKKMPAINSSSMDAIPYPEYEDWVWVKASYGLEAGVKGKDVNKQYQEFVYEYSEKLYREISEILEKYE